MNKQIMKATRKQQQPLVSVIMPVHNTGNFLVQAIESIRSQTHTNFELICVDDGSTDITPMILESYARMDKRIKVYTNSKNRGIGYSLNRGLKHVQGEFIARMDADDISLPTRFAEQLTLLKKNPSLVACGGQAAMIDPNGRVFAYKHFPTDPTMLYKMIMRMVPLQHPILMARASVFKDYLYNESVSTAEDVDMLFYLLSKGSIGNTKTLIYQYRKTDLSNGYHSVKKTFMITFASRFSAILKYGYKPNFSGLFATFMQFTIVQLFPAKLVVRVFEMLRYDPPLWKRGIRIISTLGGLLTKVKVLPSI